MISNVSMNRISPSFGQARLSQGGQKIAEDCGMMGNTYLAPDLYSKRGELSRSFQTPEQFTEICQRFGCTEFPDSNAAFIRLQLLSGDGAKKALTKQLTKTMGKKQGKETAQQIYGSALEAVYNANYDNPLLSRGKTLKLLHKLRGHLDPRIISQHEYILKGSH